MLSFLAYSLTVIMLVAGIGGDQAMGSNVQVTASRSGEFHACVTTSISSCVMQVNPGTYTITAKPLSGYPTPPLYHWVCDTRVQSVSQNLFTSLHCHLVFGL
jgi:hypothetical protein